MAIERTTETVGFSILEKGTLLWGTFTNNNWDLADNAIKLNRERITALETVSATLPLAIAGRIGHNLIRNNNFVSGARTDPAKALNWTTGFDSTNTNKTNGASGNTSRDSSTFLMGGFSQRVSIVSVNLSNQVKPFPGMNILDPESQIPLLNTDPRQLLNGFGYIYQTLNLSSKTRYTLSAYGKTEIPNNALGINAHWKVGVVFRDTSSNIINSYFSAPQTNATSSIGTDSFNRIELSFVTPNLPVVQAEVWLVSEGVTSGSIGSVHFDGVQLEQSSSATFLEAFAMRNGNIFIDGDLTIGGRLQLQQDQLVLATNQVIFEGNVQIGDNINEDLLEVFAASTFHGPVSMKGNLNIGDNATDPGGDEVNVTARRTIFFNNQDPVSPTGGNVEIQGNFKVDGSTILGNNPTTDTVQINGNLIVNSLGVDFSGDVEITGGLRVLRAVEIGTNNPSDGLLVKMSGQGVDVEGDVLLRNKLDVRNNVKLGNGVPHTLTVNTGYSSFSGDVEIGKGLVVHGPVSLNIGTTASDNFNMTVRDILVNGGSGSTIWNTQTFDLSGSLQIGSGSSSQYLEAHVGSIVLGAPSLSSSSMMTVNAISSTLTGNLNVGRTTTIGGNLLVGGFTTGTVNITGTSGLFTFGSGLISAPRSFVEFRPSVIQNKNSIPAIGGDISLGDSEAVVQVSGKDKYATTLYVNAGDTFFGNTSVSPGGELQGNVIIGGRLEVGGATKLGNDKNSDKVEMRTYEVDIKVGPGRFNIGGGFKNNTYNPLESNHGGLTADNNGNLFLDGKLTVKGPIDPTQLIIYPRLANNTLETNVITVSDSVIGTPFNLTSDGEMNIAKSIKIDDGYIANLTSTTASFGSFNSPLTSFSVVAPSINLDGTISLSGNLTVQTLAAKETTIDGNLEVKENLVVQQNITATGTSFLFGVDPFNSPTTFNAFASSIQLGGQDGLGEWIGNVVVGNDLQVRKDLNIGFYGQYDNNINLNAGKISIDVGSNKVGAIETLGLQIGGGFQNSPFNVNDPDHGGITLDNFGNIYTDGYILSRGGMSTDKILLTVAEGQLASNPLITIINSDQNQVDINFTVDGYGNVVSNGIFKAADGTTTLPAYTFVADDNTGIYRPANNELGFVVDGFKKATLNLTGFGISGDPLEQLHVRTDTGLNTGKALGRFGLQTSSDSILFGYNSTDFTDDEPALYTSGPSHSTGVAGHIHYKAKTGVVNTDHIWWGGIVPSELMRLKGSTGNLGIANDTPTEKLDVDGNLRVRIQVKAAPGTAAAPSYSFFDDINTGIYNVGTNSLGFTANGVNVGQYSSSGAWTFGTAASNPIHNFNGTGRFASPTSFDSILKLQSSVIDKGRLVFEDIADSGEIRYDHTDDSMSFYTNGSERIRIDSDGYVGIANDTPTEKLDVDGNIKLTGSLNLENGLGEEGQVPTRTTTGMAWGAGGETFELKNSSFLAEDRTAYIVDTSANPSLSITLPASPFGGMFLTIYDAQDSFLAFPPTVLRNGQLINGVADDLLIDEPVVRLVFAGGSKGWRTL